MICIVERPYWQIICLLFTFEWHINLSHRSVIEILIENMNKYALEMKICAKMAQNSEAIISSLLQELKSK